MASQARVSGHIRVEGRRCARVWIASFHAPGRVAEDVESCVGQEAAGAPRAGCGVALGQRDQARRRLELHAVEQDLRRRQQTADQREWLADERVLEADAREDTPTP
jgi:hypothetical protein